MKAASVRDAKLEVAEVRNEDMHCKLPAGVPDQ